MFVVVGSGNPVKQRATQAALARLEKSQVTVRSEAVPSGVPEQPRGHAETRRGAVNRARAARSVAIDDPDGPTGQGPRYGVGIEGGVAGFEGVGTRDEGDGRMAGDGTYLVMWAAVTDGERVGTGAGPSLPLPSAVATRVANGEELGPVMDDLLGTHGVARRQGAAGVFTDGLLDREAALAAAVAAAFGPFRSRLY
jgi:inosine/xanthosine triphosphatase